MRITLILLNPERCKGCRICEVACGFHHTGHKAFDPSRSSTHISRDNDTALITMTIASMANTVQMTTMELVMASCAVAPSLPTQKKSVTDREKPIPCLI